MRRTPFTEILCSATTLAPEQLARAEELSAQKGVRLEEALLQQHAISEEELRQAQAQHLGLPYWKELPESAFDTSLMIQVPLAFARQHKLVPVRVEDGVVLVAMSNPLDLQPLDDVSLLLQAPVAPILSME